MAVTLSLLRKFTDLMSGPADGEIADEYEKSENSRYPHRHTHQIEYLGKMEICRRCGMVMHMEYAELMDPDNPAWFRVEGGRVMEYEFWDECPNPEGAAKPS